MALSTDVMFSRISDNYKTPLPFFRELDERFGFSIDLAANRPSRKCLHYFGPDHETAELRDALRVDWMRAAQDLGLEPRGFLNNPYSLCKEFVWKCAVERRAGFLSVALLPVRTDTRWWHAYIWDRDRHRPRRGIQIEFLKSRLQFSLDVTDPMRTAVRKLAGQQYSMKRIARVVGLPLLIVRAILEAKPEAVTGAPFPSVVVVFWPDAMLEEARRGQA